MTPLKGTKSQLFCWKRPMTSLFVVSIIISIITLFDLLSLSSFAAKVEFSGEKNTQMSAIKKTDSDRILFISNYNQNNKKNRFASGRQYSKSGLLTISDDKEFESVRLKRSFSKEQQKNFASIFKRYTTDNKQIFWNDNRNKPSRNNIERDDEDEDEDSHDQDEKQESSGFMVDENDNNNDDDEDDNDDDENIDHTNRIGSISQMFSIHLSTTKSPTINKIANTAHFNHSGQQSIENETSFRLDPSCSSNEFRCHSDGNCISIDQHCDGWTQCSDGSDEHNCSRTLTKECRKGEFLCYNGTCINEKQKCNDYKDCLDGSDEHDCNCQANQFRCRTVFECIDNKLRCDYKHDCLDKTDELHCDENVCALGQFKCQNGQCISEKLKCNGIKDCLDGSDESDCGVKQCRADQFQCNDGMKCISQSLVCNQEYDCFDGSDELKCIENNCLHESMFRCRDGQCIPKDFRCNFHKDCFDGTDELGCQMICGAHEFECHTDGHCIHESLRCDGFYDCYDFSDEQYCENRTCRLSQFRCGTGLCIDRAFLCNGESDCPDRSDELECWICQKGQYTCANGRCIDRKQRCDGVQDCQDNSDEQDCPRTKISLQVYPERQTVRQGQEAVFRCRDEGDSRLPVRWSREDGNLLPPETVDNRGRLLMFNVQVDYSGVYVCTTATGIGSSLAQKAAYLTVQPTFDYEIMINHLPQNDQGETQTEFEPTSSLANLQQCTNNEFTCSNGECVLKEHVCDKDLDCSDQSDELNCQCEPNEFKCDNGFCILKVYRCDTENDCGDSSDERFCEQEEYLNSTCKTDEYQCESGNQCIPKSFQCDGRFDCQDKSDEIGCSKPTIVKNPSTTVITVEGETVTLTCRAIGLPIPLINWRKNGNMHIPDPPKATSTSINGLGTLTIYDVVRSDQGTYSCEAINSKESQLARNETILIVKPLNLLCQPPFFNDLATDISECLQCFCFGLTDTCYSSSIQPYSITLNDQMKLKVAAIGKLSNGDFVDVSDTYPPNQSAIQLDPITREHAIDSTIALSHTPDSVYFYWRLPEAFQGNQLMSYGNHLRYLSRHREPFTPSPLDLPDVIIRGNNITMFHYEKHYFHGDNDGKKKAVRFWVGEWKSYKPNVGLSEPMIIEDLNRESILLALQNIEDILIKASYDAIILESSIVDIELESGLISNDSDPSRSAYIEQCICPAGYTGTSCDECAPGYIRQHLGRYLGECVQVQITCQCNGHSNECDPYTGQCLNCQNHTQGFYCEQCERGYYNNPIELNSSGSVNCMKCPCGSNIDRHHQNSNIFEDEWAEFPQTWLLIPCRYDNSKRSVVCEACPIGYEGELCDKCELGYIKKINESGQLVCSLKVDCPDGQFQCSNGTCIDESHRCNKLIDCLPDGNDEFGCACISDKMFRCLNGKCIDVQFYCDGIANCLDDSDEINCNESLITCDPMGSIRNISTNIQQCECKQLVTGPFCDKCTDGAFYLNEMSSTGCIECFCFGTTGSCNGATNLYRNHIAVNIDQYIHGIVLRDLTNPSILRQDLSFDHINRELIFKNFNQSTSLYWQLPFNFLGNKITSYGGFLNYTFRFHGNYFQRHHRNPDAILIGNNITLEYYFKGNLQPLFANIIAIPLFEIEWQLENGQPASRRELMTVLANLDSILLLATVTNDISSIGLISITLDTSVEHNYGKSNMSSAQKVKTVEICHCPTGYSGTSCERCAPGFKLFQLNENSLLDDDDDVGYKKQFHACVPCFCNGHSIDCDSITGICIDCQHHTTGPYCEKCLPGYEGNATQGTVHDCSSSQGLASLECACNMDGTRNSDCQIDNSQCDCKLNVDGYRCDVCKEGYFFLNRDNPLGCVSCFCFGMTHKCKSSSYYRTQIEADFSNYYENKFELATRYQTYSYSDRISYNFSNNEVHFYSLFWLHENVDPDSNLETLYWFLPRHFLGNRLTSYGGKIRFTRRYIVQNEGNFINDADVFLLGNGIMLQYISSAIFPNNVEQSFEIGINAEDEMWQKIDHQTQMTGLASRTDFLHVLANVEIIAIRATFHTQMKESFLKNVALDSAVPENTGQPLALEVEQCSCPEGYLGLSCEQCAPNYLREIDHNGQFKCVPCKCNSHSQMCDPLNGKCVNCQDNTAGNHCEKCAVGFFGDATRGKIDDCQPCPCPTTSLYNNFSPTCKLDIDGLPTCTQCLKNYTGRNCEVCNTGFTRNESIPNSRCEPIQSIQTIKVHIEGPKVKHVSAGSTLILKCNGSSQVSQYFNLDWIKLEGQLPPAYSEASGILTIPNIQPEHGGTYVCSGFDLESVSTARTIVVVKQSVQKFVPKVHIEPEYLEVHVGNPVIFKCIADGLPKPRLSWKAVQDKILNPASSFSPETGIFFIPSAKKSDEAEYECHATNSAGSDTRKTVLFVHDYHKYAYVHMNGMVPTARVSPSTYQLIKGEKAKFECNVTGKPIPSVRWIFLGSEPDGHLPNNSRVMGNILTLTNINVYNSGVYTCIASNSYGTAESQVRLYVDGKKKSKPVVSVEPTRQTVIQGQTGELRCIVSGFPKPTISWHKLYDQIDPHRHEITGDRLMIKRMEVEDRGIYVCRAENHDGISNASAFVEIERREIPSIEIDRIAINRGLSIYFQCRITGGIPEPIVEWRRSDGSPFTSNAQVNGGLLQFNQVEVQDEGVYVCSAENIAGRATAQTSLTIPEVPRVKILQNTPFRVRQNEFVKLECKSISFNYSSKTSFKLNWHKLKSNYVNQTFYELPRHSVTVEDNRATLQINSANVDDSGIYVCSLYSPLGDSEERIQLIVEQNSNIVPDVNVEEKVVTVAAGSRAELRCFVRGTKRNIIIKWIRADNISLPEMSRVENGTLTIDQVKPADSGDYYCLGYLNDHSQMLFKNRARLAVVVPPRIQVDPPLQTVRPGDTAYVDCVAVDESHLVSITWSRIGSELPSGVIVEADTSTGTTRLIFQGILLTDAGKYLCTAVNAAGRVEALTEIIVDEENFNNIAEEFVIIGSNIDLKCPTEFIESDFDIEWKYENSESLPDNVQVIENRLKIQNIVSHNIGRYICVVTWNDSKIEENVLILNVKEPTYKNCNPHQFTCFNGECIDITLRCNKIYDCQDQSDEESCTPISTDIRIIANKEIVNFNDQLQLTCLINNKDPLKHQQVEWSLITSSQESMRKNVLVEKNKLFIEPVEYENGGVYRCSIEIDGHKIEADYLLVIQELWTANFSTEIAEKRIISIGSELKLTCDNNMSGPLSYSWKKYQSSDPTLEDKISPQTIMYPNGTLLIPNVSKSDQGTFICVVANTKTTLKIPTIVIVEGLVPRFIQKPLSYLSLPALPNAYISFELSISIKPEHSEGLILYNGQGGNGDFISLGLKNSFVEFRFELGGGVTMIRSVGPIELHHWHLIHISRNGNIGKLRVDDQDIVTSSSNRNYIGLDLTQPMYVGGVPSFESISSFNGFNKGFVGCISRFQTNSRLYDLIKNSSYQHGLSRCDTCLLNSCLNGGFCKENTFYEEGYECICANGFSGKRCHLFTDACYPGLCNNGYCLEDKISRFICQCPFGKTGRYCEQSISILDPLFSNGAYLAYRTPTNTLNRLDIKLRVKPNFASMNSDHLLLYCGQYSNGTGDFTALVFVNKSVEFRFNTGSGAAIIRSSLVLSDQKWVNIVVRRDKKEAHLTVNGMETVSGRSPGKTVGLNLKTPLYIGSYNKSKIVLPASLSQLSHFDGCISQLEINDRNIDLIKQHIESVNVDNCGLVSLCQRSPCLNGGSCLEINQTFYECICNDDYIGKHCEKSKGVCERTMPCMNNGHCENYNDSFLCHCSIGYSGAKCQQEVIFVNQKSARMNGQSFFSFDRSFLTQSTHNYIEIKFKIRTYSPNGLLFFYGPPEDNHENISKKSDFLSASINDSHIEMTFELGSGPGHVTTDIKIDDGQVHHVVLRLQDQEGSIEVDKNHYFGRSLGFRNTLNANGDIYFGGVPNYDMTQNLYVQGYSGCISDIKIGVSNEINIVNSSKQSRNLVPCEDV